jgi:arsenate reductase
MAEAFFNHLAAGKATAISAGTRPSAHTDSNVVKSMFEVGIDICAQKPKPLTIEMLEDSDRVITMGCSVEKACPASFVPAEDWELNDPEGKSLEEVRRIRDQIKAKVEALIKELK